MSKLSDSLPVNADVITDELWHEVLANAVHALLELPPVWEQDALGKVIELDARTGGWDQLLNSSPLHKLRVSRSVVLNRGVKSGESEKSLRKNRLVVYSDNLDRADESTVIEAIAQTGRYFACAEPGLDVDNHFFRPVTEDCSLCPHYLACVLDGHAVNTLETP